MNIPLAPGAIKDIMNEKAGVINNLLYRLYIALENKQRSNLTATAMKIMNPPGPAHLSEFEMVVHQDASLQYYS
ncbi:hypothetical protein Ciccas_006836 [Cichlidogyrus casuarinus]|uniref:Uncharacterized protein n=1 Tax=Cichlidogyrus casuarinus TaxID=1844966 RepID=A0ABD2Q4L6_9PLAT